MEALSAGATHIGYNYVQEAALMYRLLGDKAQALEWHMIGHLQSNKIPRALRIFTVFQTIDSLELARELNKGAEKLGKQVPIYIEINSGDESSKTGMALDYQILTEAVKEIAKLKYLLLKGFMTMGPNTLDAARARYYFRKTKEIFDSIQALHIPQVTLTTLSMGMSQSYKTALEEGSTMIRLGTIVFGERNV